MPDTPSLAGIDLAKGTELRQSADPVRDRAQIKTLAQEFEAMLMLQMIRGMRQSMLDESEDVQGLGGEIMRDTFDGELARHLARAGGFGLGSMLSGQLERDLVTTPATDPSANEPKRLDPETPSLPLSAPVQMPLPAAVSSPIDPALSVIRQPPASASRSADTDVDDFRLSLPIDGATTSAFGMRADPMTGRSRAHRGVDLRAAYGTEVPAADGGEVVFAGERGAYGNLVVLRHGNGVETRYAHLSSIAVTPGETIAAGASIGRVGSTGRSTAPHLHFEVLVNGQRVDPERIAARVGRGPLKFPSQADD